MINQMSKSIILTPECWAAIRQKISNNYPRSVLLMRNKMKEVLGFTPRIQEEWFETNNKHRSNYCVRTIHLDFYNEPKRVMFLLRYSEIINEGNSWCK